MSVRNTDTGTASIALKYPPREKYLPTSREEMDALGWKQADIILFSGDAYIDHPSFAAAVLGRYMQSLGYKVAIVPQPNWRDDLRDFKKLGPPRLFFGVSAGAMDSMVNHYTAARRLRHDDAFTAGGRHGMRPDFPTIVYCKILKELYPDVPVITGGIEASMRRFAHYDYWSDKLRPSILIDSPADMLIYGMGERPFEILLERINKGEKIEEIKNLPQSVVRMTDFTPSKTDVVLSSYEQCLNSKKEHARNFRFIEEESNRIYGESIWQKTGNIWIKANPMLPPGDIQQTDKSFDLPYTRLPHPRYKNKRIPAYEMIRHSVCLHRGCFGGCAFCTISAHQGKFIQSRSPESIMREVNEVTKMQDFKGYISDLGGPSANMYFMGGKDLSKCEQCRRPSCLFPKVCKNLNNDHRPLLDIYHSVDSIPQIKKSFIGSGVRYDLSMSASDDAEINSANWRYMSELISKHVSGRLKVAPEHTSERVLNCMRKPSFGLYHDFKNFFDKECKASGLNQQLIPYFISSHPACREEDMAELAVETKKLGLRLEQVQDFTPTPMTLSTEIYYTGYHPYTLEKIYTARTDPEKQAQREFFFWWKPESRQKLIAELIKLHRKDLIPLLFPNYRGFQENKYKNSYNREKENKKYLQKFQKKRTKNK